jgi:hypothetical protein
LPELSEVAGAVLRVDPGSGGRRVGRYAGPGWRAAAVAGAAALVSVAGCSRSTEEALPESPGPASTVSAAPPSLGPPVPTTGSTGGPRSPIVWLDRRSGDPRADAVQRTVQAYWSMVVRLAERPDPADPALAVLTGEPQRGELVAVFSRTRQQGLSQRGPVWGTVTVSGVRGGQARATSCLDNRFVRVYGSNGKVRPGSGGRLDPFILELRGAGTEWKVSSVRSPSGHCTIPGR